MPTNNQILHEWMGKCWHDDASQGGSPFACGKCDEPRHWNPNPAYDQSLDLCAEAEKVIIRELGSEQLGKAYQSALENFSMTTARFDDHRLRHEWIVGFATMPGDLRVQAMVELIGRKDA